MQQRILSLLVDNTSGVLSRISGLFSRRGYNIDSISAGATADKRFYQDYCCMQRRRADPGSD